MTDIFEKSEQYMIEAPDEVISGLLHVSAINLISLQPGDIHSLSSKDDWYFVASLNGKSSVAGENAIWQINSNSAIIIKAEAVSFLTSEVQGECLLIEFGGLIANQLSVTLLENNQLYFPNSIRYSITFLNEVRAVQKHENQISAVKASACLYTLLMNVYNLRDDSISAQKPLNQIVEAALGIIHNQYAFLTGIGELAAQLEVSQEYLTRVFNRYLGITPGRYLTQVRIEHSKALLVKGDYSIQFISEACGFANANYFARVFRSITGMSPKEYRKSENVNISNLNANDNSIFVL